LSLILLLTLPNPDRPAAGAVGSTPSLAEIEQTQALIRPEHPQRPSPLTQARRGYPGRSTASRAPSVSSRMSVDPPGTPRTPRTFGGPLSPGSSSGFLPGPYRGGSAQGRGRGRGSAPSTPRGGADPTSPGGASDTSSFHGFD